MHFFSGKYFVVTKKYMKVQLKKVYMKVHCDNAKFVKKIKKPSNASQAKDNEDKIKNII